MKKIITFSRLIILVLLIAISFTACATADVNGEETQTTAVVVDVPVIAEGLIVPKADHALVFLSSGTVESIFISEGDWVQNGDPLIQLEGREPLNAEMESLSYQLLVAEQAMTDLELQAGYEREQAALKIIEAQTTFNTAQEAYDQFDFDQYEEDLDAIKEDMIEAQRDVEDAEDELADYSDLEEDNPTREKYQKAVDDAEDALNELTRKKSELVNQHDQVVRSIDAAQAGLEIAQEEYEKKTNGPDADQLAILNAQINSIHAAMDAVTYKLDQLLLTAPITGQVMEIKPRVNEAITAGQVVLILADTKEWYVETDDLNELEIVEVSEGQSVQIEVEAFPDQYYTGTVLEISNMPNFSQGDVLYTVKIRFLEQDLPDLRWGMTVITTFEQ